MSQSDVVFQSDLPTPELIFVGESNSELVNERQNCQFYRDSQPVRKKILCGDKI